MRKWGEIGILIVKELIFLNKSGFGIFSYDLSLVIKYYYYVVTYVIYNFTVIYSSHD